MRILVIEPYFGGSHKSFVMVLKQHSGHQIDMETLPARFWKWRLSGAPFHFAERFRDIHPKPDLLLFSNTIDIAAFISLAGEEAFLLPKVAFFHENQIVYPLSDKDVPDAHYGLINITSALSADEIWFNSDFHRRTFVNAIGPFLGQFPDFVPRGLEERVNAKSRILPIPLEPLPEVPMAKEKGPVLRILWNHRWEYDKAPETFFGALEKLLLLGIDFEVVVVGEGFNTRPPVFDQAREKLGNRVLRFGYAENREEYAAWVRACDVVVSCARQEYFGVSVAEAVLAGCFPILPNRLVYPDFIPQERRWEHLYNSEAELIEMLRRASQRLDELRRMPPLGYYDSLTVANHIPRMDAELERLAREKKERRAQGHFG